MSRNQTEGYTSANQKQSRKGTKKRLVLGAAVAGIALFMGRGASTADAAEIFWDGANGGSWGTATNWAGDVLPGSGDIARFGNIGLNVPVNFSLNVSPSIQAVVFDNQNNQNISLTPTGAVTMTLSGGADNRVIYVAGTGDAVTTMGTAGNPGNLTINLTTVNNVIRTESLAGTSIGSNPTAPGGLVLNANLNYGSNEAQFSGYGKTVVNGALNTTGGLLVDDGGGFTGGVLINSTNLGFRGNVRAERQGTLSVASFDAIGGAANAATGATISLRESGGLDYAGTGSATSPFNIVIDNSGALGASNAAGTLVITNGLTLNNRLTVRGTGTLEIANTATVNVVNSATVDVDQGTLKIADLTKLGFGTLDVASGVFTPGPTTGMRIGSGTTGGKLLYTGAANNAAVPIDGFGGVNNAATIEVADANAHLYVVPANPDTYNAPFGSGLGAGDPQNVLVKTGPGTLHLGANHLFSATYGGAVSIQQGTLAIKTLQALGHGNNAVKIGDGATLQIDATVIDGVNLGLDAGGGYTVGERLGDFNDGGANSANTPETTDDAYGHNGALSGGHGRNRQFIFAGGQGILDLRARYLLLNDGPTGSNPVNQLQGPGVMVKRGDGTLRVGADFSYNGNNDPLNGPAQLGGTIIEAGAVRLDHHLGVGTNGITAKGTGGLWINTATPVANAISLQTGGQIRAVGADRVVSGTVTAPSGSVITFDSADPETAGRDNNLELTGGLTATNGTIKVDGNDANVTKGLVLLTGTNNLTGSTFDLQAGGVLHIAATGSPIALSSIQMNGGTLGLRSDTNATVDLSTLPTPAGDYGIFVGRVTAGSPEPVITLNSALNVPAGGKLSVGGNGTGGAANAVLAPTAVNLAAAGGTINVVGATLRANSLTVGGSPVAGQIAAPLTVSGDRFGRLELNNANYDFATLNINGGVTRIQEGRTLHATNLGFNGGTIELGAGSSGPGAVMVLDNPTINVTSGSNGIVQGAGTNLGKIELSNGVHTINVADGANMRLQGVTNAAGAVGSIVKQGGGTLNMDGASTFGNATNGIVVDGGTLGVSAGTALGNGPLTLNGATLSLGGNFQPGLSQGRVAGAFNTLAANPNNFGITLGTPAAQFVGTTNATTPVGGIWLDNTTVVYNGQIFIPDPDGDGFGQIAFAEHFDDSVQVKIDGTVRLTHGTWNVPTASGRLTLEAGWHDLDLRFGQGTGGVGPSNNGGWTTALGFGIDMDGDVATETANPIQANYTAPVDNGSGNLFRTGTSSPSMTLNAGNRINVAADSTIDMSGLVTRGTVTAPGGMTLDATTDNNLKLTLGGVGRTLIAGSAELKGNNATIEVAGSGSLLLNDAIAAGTLTVNRTGAGSLGFGGNGSMANVTLNVAAGSALTAIAGAGNPLGGALVNLQGDGSTLRVSGSGAGVIAANVNVDGNGVIQKVGAGSAVLGGAGNTIAVDPGQTLTLSGIDGSLTINANLQAPAVSKIGSGTIVLAGAGTNVAQVNVGGGTLRLGAGTTAGNVSLLGGTINGARLETGGNEVITGPITLNGGVIDLGGNTETVPSVTIRQGTIQNGTLISPAPLVKTGNVGHVGRIATVTNVPSTNVTGGTLQVANPTAVAGSLGAITVSPSATLNPDYVAGGANPLGTSAVTLNSGTLRVSGTDGSTTAGLLAALYNHPNVNIAGQNPEFSSTQRLEARLAQFPVSIVGNTAGGGVGIDFTNAAFGAGAPFAPLGFNSADNIITMMRGQIDIATAGQYNFLTASDDGTLVWIDGELVVDNSYYQGNTTRNGVATLAAGKHDIVIGFFEGSGGAGMAAFYSLPGSTAQPQAVLPNAVLSSQSAVVTNAITASGNSALGASDTTAVIQNLTVSGTLRTTSGPVKITGGTFAGDTIMNAAGTQVSGMGGAGKLTKVGTGTLVLDGPNTYSGGTVVEQGTVRVTNANAMGTGAVLVGKAGALDAIGVLNLANVTVQGNGYSTGIPQTGGRLTIFDQSTAPTAPIAGTVEIRPFNLGNSFEGVKLAPGGTLSQLNGVPGITGDGDRTTSFGINLPGTGQSFLQMRGNVWTINPGVGGSGISGTGGITALGGDIRLESVSTYSGKTIVEGGALRLRGLGTALNSSEAIVYGGTFTVNDSGNTTAPANVINFNRWADTAPITLHSGTLELFMRTDGNLPTVKGKEVLGTVTVPGAATINVNAGGDRGIAYLEIGNLVRPLGGRVAFSSTTNTLGDTTAANSRYGQIDLLAINGAPVALTNGILGGGFTVGSEFATYGAEGGAGRAGVTVLPTNHASVVDHTVANWAANKNVRVTAATAATMAAETTINSMNWIASGSGGNTLTLDARLNIGTGGFLYSGGQDLTVQGGGSLTSLSNTTGGTSELFLISGRTINIDVPIVDNGVNGSKTAVHVSGGNTVRLRNTNNTFTGGVFLASGSLTAQSTGNFGSTLGTNDLNFVGASTLNLRDDSPGTYGNNINVLASSTISVDRSSGTGATGATFGMGNLTIGNGRTLTVNTGNSTRMDVNNIQVNGLGIYNNNANTTVLGSIKGNADAVFVKGGTGFLSFPNNTPNDATGFLGSVVVNAGLLQIQADQAFGSLTPTITVNNSGILVYNGPQPRLDNVTFNPGSGLRLRTDVSTFSGATLPNSPLPVFEVELGGGSIGGDYDGVVIAENGIFRNLSNSNADYNSDMTFLPGSTINQAGSTWNFNGKITQPVGTTTPIFRTGGGTLVLTNADNHIPGGWFIGTGGGVVRGTVAGAFGTGPIEANGGPADLSFSGAAVNTVTAIDNQVQYNANWGAGGHVVSARGRSMNLVGEVRIGTAVTGFTDPANPNSTPDTFDIEAWNIISGAPAQLALLNRNASGAGVANVELAPNAVVGHHSPGGTIADIGNNVDLFYGVANGDHNGATVTLGANTPWKGMTGDRSDRRFTNGTIILDDGSAGGTQPATFAKAIFTGLNGAILRIGSGNSGNVVNILNPAGQGRVIVEVDGGPANSNNQFNNRVGLESGGVTPIANYSGVEEFQVTGHLFLERDNVQGGANGTRIPAVRIMNGGFVDFNATSSSEASRTGNFVTGQLVVEAGGTMWVNDSNNLKTSTGSLLIKTGGVLRFEGGADRNLNGSALAPIFQTGTYQDGIIVRLDNADNTPFLSDAFPDSTTYMITGSDHTQDAQGAEVVKGLSLGLVNGVLGGLTQDNAGRTFSGNTPIIVNGGARFSSTTLQTLNVSPNLSGTNYNLTIGTTGTIDLLTKRGQVNLNGTVAANVVTIEAGALGAGGNNSAAVIAGTFASGGVVLDNATRFEMNLNLAGATTNVAQKITIKGDEFLNINDNRRLRVARTNTSNSVVNLNNVVLGPDALWAIDEQDTDVRVALTMQGNAVYRPVNDQTEIISIASDVAGQRRTLYQGVGIDTGRHDQRVVGAISGDITITQIRGGLDLLGPSTNAALAGNGTLAPGAIVNMLGIATPLPLHDGSTSAANLDGQVIIRTGHEGSNGITTGLTSGTFNVDGGQDLRIRTSENAAAGVLTTQVVGSTINVGNVATATVNGAPANALIASDRETDRDGLARSVAANVNLAPGAILHVQEITGTQMQVGGSTAGQALRLQGNAGVISGSTGSTIYIGNVTDDGKNFDLAINHTAATNVWRFIGEQQGTVDLVQGQNVHMDFMDGFKTTGTGRVNMTNVLAGELRVRAGSGGVAANMIGAATNIDFTGNTGVALGGGGTRNIRGYVQEGATGATPLTNTIGATINVFATDADVNTIDATINSQRDGTDLPVSGIVDFTNVHLGNNVNLRVDENDGQDLRVGLVLDGALAAVTHQYNRDPGAVIGQRVGNVTSTVPNATLQVLGAASQELWLDGAVSGVAVQNRKTAGSVNTRAGFDLGNGTLDTIASTTNIAVDAVAGPTSTIRSTGGTTNLAAAVGSTLAVDGGTVNVTAAQTGLARITSAATGGTLNATADLTAAELAIASGATLNKTGVGNVTISGNALNNGTLALNGGNASVAVIRGTGANNLADGTSLTVRRGTPAAPDTLASRVASEMGELSLTGTAYVELVNNDLVIRGSDLSDGVADSTAAFAAVISGRGTTGPNATKLHDGPGLRSSEARDYNDDIFVDVLGLTAVLNGDLNLAFNSSTTTKTTFGGLDVTPDDTLVRFGMIADLNFDGAITAQDYFAVDQGFLGRVLTRSDGSVVTGALTGDLTGDGQVNASDYFLIDQAFLRQGGTPIDAMVEFQRAAFGDEFVQAAFGMTGGTAGAVPEPATLSLLALAATSLLGRRRRRN